MRVVGTPIKNSESHGVPAGDATTLSIVALLPLFLNQETFLIRKAASEEASLVGRGATPNSPFVQSVLIISRVMRELHDETVPVEGSLEAASIRIGRLLPSQPFEHITEYRPLLGGVAVLFNRLAPEVYERPNYFILSHDFAAFASNSSGTSRNSSTDCIAFEKSLAKSSTLESCGTR